MAFDQPARQAMIANLVPATEMSRAVALMSATQNIMRIVGASALLKGRTQITNLDYRDVFEECRASDLVYMDPPYQGVCGNRDKRYAPKVVHDEFCAAL